MSKLSRYGLTIIALVIIQTLILGWMVNTRVQILRSPDVVTLQSEPVDPRDLFRGDYVTLNYSISSLSLTSINGDMDWKNGDTIFVELTPMKNNWRAIAAFHEHTVPALGNKIIRGGITSLDTTRNIARIDYGIERYFVPEGAGHTLESERNKRALSVDVAIASDGEAAIKGIRVDNKPVYEEPLF